MIPNTALILIVVISILYGREPGIKAALMAGLLQDVFFIKDIGVNLLIYMLIAYIIDEVRKRLFKDNFLTPALLIILSTVFYHGSYFIIMYFLRNSISFILIFRKIVPIESLLNTIVGLLVYKRFYEYRYDRRLR